MRVLGYKLLDYYSPTEEKEMHSFIRFLHEAPHKSHAQLFQDKFVEFTLNGKRDGFFVEFGATDGVTLNNTLYLETHLGWTGILAEPARCWREKMTASGRRCRKDFRCVWSKSGEHLVFNEVSDSPQYSTINHFSDSGGHARVRKTKNCYDVATVSLNDLLVEHAAPRHIDYLSIDTEGSEFDILNAFDFDRWNVSIITVEHNDAPIRKDIYRLLASKGYQRKFQWLSRWDDWYVRTQAAPRASTDHRNADG